MPFYLITRNNNIHLPAHPLIHTAKSSLRPLHLLLHLARRLFSAGAVFEEEGELFERAAVGFGEHEIDEDNLKGEPAAVRNKPLPLHALQTDRVDKSRKEARRSRKELEDRYALCPVGEWKELDQERCFPLAKIPQRRT
jgi:hypothetical protein